MQKLLTLLMVVLFQVSCVSNEFVTKAGVVNEEVTISDVDYSSALNLLPGEASKWDIPKSSPFLKIEDDFYGKYRIHSFNADSGQVWNIEMQGLVRGGLKSVVTSLILQPYIIVIDPAGEQLPGKSIIKPLAQDWSNPKRISNTTTITALAEGKHHIICIGVNKTLANNYSKTVDRISIAELEIVEKYGPAVTGNYTLRLFQ